MERIGGRLMKKIRAAVIATVYVFGVGFLTSTVAAEKPGLPSKSATPAAAKSRDDRGRYLVTIAGCNDCHTAGYADAAGKIPEKDWLTGDRIGWRGPWGTTYASNLRLYMQHLSEEQWVTVAREAEFRPPMPWYILREMTEQDLRAIYRFIRTLGPAGQEAPAFLPPTQEPPEPYILFPASP
jgi:mono/diheme cytochrome c family protein